MDLHRALGKAEFIRDLLVRLASAQAREHLALPIRWVVERSLAWISRYRRLNTIFERTEGHLVAFVEIAFISILSRRLVRLVTQEISA